MKKLPVQLSDIQKARKKLQGVVHNTPFIRSRTFSRMAGVETYLKLENLQRGGSFKIRGAYNKISSLKASVRKRGVVAASAGNHAQGVALAANKYGIPATVVMPEHAPISKQSAVTGYGADRFYRVRNRMSAQMEIGYTGIDVTLETHGDTHNKEIIGKLQSKGYKVTRL